MNDPIMGHCRFVEGAFRPVYADDEGQYLLEDGKRIDGLFLDPDQVLDQPLIVDTVRQERVALDGQSRFAVLGRAAVHFDGGCPPGAGEVLQGGDGRVGPSRSPPGR